MKRKLLLLLIYSIPLQIHAQTNTFDVLFDNNSKQSESEINNIQTLSIISSNSVLCGSNIPVVLSSSVTGPGYSFEWRKFDNNVGYVTIPNEQSSSINVYETGRYALNVKYNSSYYGSVVKLVTNADVGVLTNSFGNNNPIVLAPPNYVENLTINLSGNGPWAVGLNEGGEIKEYVANISPLVIQVSPTYPTQYNIVYVANSCGVSYDNLNIGYLNVEPSPSSAISFPVPPILNVCPGNTINIPFVTTGSIVGSKSEFGVFLSGTSGVTRQLYSYTRFPFDIIPANGTLDLYIPENTIIGSYGLYLGINNMSGSFPFSTYNINVVNLGCVTSPAPLVYAYSNSCNSTVLRSSVYGTFLGNNNSYQWYKNGISMTGKTSETITVYETGNYSVQVINAGYDQTSAPKTITINQITPLITSANSAICGANPSSILSTNYTGVGYTYQWFKDRAFSTGAIEQIPLFGEINPTLNVTGTGSYSVKIWDGVCSRNSKSGNVDGSGSLLPGTSFLVSATPNAKLSKIDGTNTSIIIAPSTSANLRVTLSGSGPWNFQVQDSDNNTISHSTNTSPYDFMVSPATSKLYSITNFSSACGAGTTNGNVQVIVSPEPSFSINSDSPTTGNSIFASTNVCPGSTIPISYAVTGNWGTDRDMTVELVNPTTNQPIVGSFQEGYSTNPIQYFIPYNIPLGTYKMKLTSRKPFIEASIFSAYNVTVTSTDCILPVATIKAISSCSKAELTATPTGLGFTYQWLKNSTNIAGATNENYTAIEDGIYTVIVNNATTSFNSSSAAYTLSINEINGTITSNNGSLCDNSGSIVLNSSNTAGLFSHQWYYSSNNASFSPVSGAINSSFSPSNSGLYYDVVSSGGCEVKSNILATCSANINFVSKSVCSNSTVYVPFTFTGGANQLLTIQLLNANTNAVVVADLFSLTSIGSTAYNPAIGIPISVLAGSYKFKIIGTGFSSISHQILTISSQASGAAPSLVASVPNVITAQNVTITALGCIGDISWTNGINSTFPISQSLVGSTTTFKATCTEQSTGCISPEGSVTVIFGELNPCINSVTLISITDDINSGTLIKQANNSLGTITASNKITGTANVIYRAGKSISLEPGFKADNGVVFKTEFGGCN